MKRLIITVLIICTVWLGVCLAPYAERRQPTESEYHTYLPIIQLWIGRNWEKVKGLGDEIKIEQKITEVTYCCIDSDENKHIHIVDIKFHAKYYDHNRMIEEKDMVQRILFELLNGRVVDFDPLPAYKLEEVV